MQRLLVHSLGAVEYVAKCCYVRVVNVALWALDLHTGVVARSPLRHHLFSPKKTHPAGFYLHHFTVSLMIEAVSWLASEMQSFGLLLFGSSFLVFSCVVCFLSFELHLQETARFHLLSVFSFPSSLLLLFSSSWCCQHPTVITARCFCYYSHAIRVQPKRPTFFPLTM